MTPTTTASAARRAEIIGGGIVGLAAASTLTRAGWKVRVHERHDELREVGAAIGIKPGAATVLRKLGILERVSSNIVLTREERRSGDGRVLQSRTLTGGQRFYNPLRQDLLNALRDLAVDGGVEILTGSEVTHAIPDGAITLNDGSSATADLVIAADGFHSRTRAALGLERAAYTLPGGTTRVLVPRESEEEIRLEYWSGKLRIGIAPAAETITYAYLNAPESDGRAARVPIDAAHWASHFPDLPFSFFERASRADAVRHAYPVVSCRSWTSGRCVLIGDAAHALPATLGVGASLGIVNAHYLAEELRDCSVAQVPGALQRWERARRGPTVRTQHMARAYDLLTRRCPPPIEPARNRLMRLLDQPWLNERVLGLKAIEV